MSVWTDPHTVFALDKEIIDKIYEKINYWYQKELKIKVNLEKLKMLKNLCFIDFILMACTDNLKEKENPLNIIFFSGNDQTAFLQRFLELYLDVCLVLSPEYINLLKNRMINIITNLGSKLIYNKKVIKKKFEELHQQYEFVWFLYFVNRFLNEQTELT